MQFIAHILFHTYTIHGQNNDETATFRLQPILNTRKCKILINKKNANIMKEFDTFHCLLLLLTLALTGRQF